MDAPTLFAAIFAHVAASSLKAGALAIVVLALTAALGRKLPARFRHALWMLVLLRLLLPAAPASSISLFNLIGPGGLAGRAPAGELRIVAPDPQAAPSVALPSAADAAGRRASWTAPAVGAAVWMAIAAALLARAALHSWRFARRVGATSRPPGAEVEAMLAEVAAGNAPALRPVRILETAAVDNPALFGIWRPVILLPPGFCERYGTRALRNVLRHELAHAQRHDVALAALAAGLRALHWFNPLVTLAVVRLAEERELACDELALAGSPASDRHSYGETVLEIASGCARPTPEPGLVGMSSPEKRVKRRIAMIATYRKSATATIAGLAITAAVAIAGLTDAKPAAKSASSETGGVTLTIEGSPAIEAMAAKLETSVSVTMAAATVADVLAALGTAAGVSIALSPEIGPADLPAVTLRATERPADLVLFRLAGELDLLVGFEESGIVLKPMLAGGDRIIMKKRTAGLPGEEAAHDGERIVIRRRAEEGASDEKEIVLEEEDGKQKRVVIRRSTEEGVPQELKFKEKRKMKRRDKSDAGHEKSDGEEVRVRVEYLRSGDDGVEIQLHP